MAEFVNPFHDKGKIKLSSELLGPAHDRALDMAARLATGETTELPDGVLDLLTQHTQAVDSPVIGGFRGEIAQNLQGTEFGPDCVSAKSWANLCVLQMR